MIAGIQGAPGDGNLALRTAFGVMLENANIPQVDELDNCTLAVSAEISTQRTGGHDQVNIIWQIHDANGRSLGEVAQTNEPNQHPPTPETDLHLILFHFQRKPCRKALNARNHR